ncbi:DUF5999 family protein [Streptomyces sp. NPDC001750]|uniref:DUF5999 family protein n=1 Tax=Streptomyces sp. NPDC001750 TaxID=3364607 RepID=UPI0036A40632
MTTPIILRTPADGCPHTPACPGPQAADRAAARTRRHCPEQGWTLLCNGVLLFEDTGALLPSGHLVGPRRSPTSAEQGAA